MLTSLITSLGLGTPLGRGTIFAILTGSFIYIMEPNFAFMQVQDPEDEENIFSISKPFAFFASDEEKPFSTYLPWYVYPVIAFIIGSVFI